jgi:hypothetical protein
MRRRQLQGSTVAEPDTAPYDDEEPRAVKEARREPRISWPDAEGTERGLTLPPASSRVASLAL